MFEAMAFKSTHDMTHQQVVSALDDLGAIPTANSSREQLLLSVDVLRNSLPEAFQIFADIVLHPKIGTFCFVFRMLLFLCALIVYAVINVCFWDRANITANSQIFLFLPPLLSSPRTDVDEVEESKMILGLHLESMAPELMVKEAIQEAAYPGQALGRPHFVTPETLPR